ncbi:hypothetical protein D9M69_588910 [compost metagenome]
MDTLRDPLRGSHWHCRLVHHQARAPKAGAQLVDHRQHVGQVGRAIFAAGGAHGDEDDVRLDHALFDTCHETQLAAGQVGLEHGLQARLIEGGLAAGQTRQAKGVALHATDLVAHLGKAGCRYQAHIPRTNDANLHG